MGKVRAVWTADEPSQSSISVMVSNDNGSTWEVAENNLEVSFSTQGAGNELLYSVVLGTSDNTVTPMLIHSYCGMRKVIQMHHSWMLETMETGIGSRFCSSMRVQSLLQMIHK